MPILLSIIFSLLSFIFFIFDKTQQHRYLNFILYIISISIPFINCLIDNKAKIKKLILAKPDYYFIILCISVVISSFLFIDKYPYVSVGDEIRDGGIDAVSIYTNEQKNIFGYGRYNAHGLFIPLYNSLFYPFFQNTKLLFRIPSAIIFVFGVVIYYQLIKQCYPKIAFWASLFMATYPLNIYYVRTETVITFSILLSSILIGVLLLFNEKKLLFSHLILLSIFLGFCFNFHASIKTFSLISIPLVFYLFIKHKFPFYNIIFIIGFIIIGFGPKILITDLPTLLHLSRFSTDTSILSLITKYIDSVKVLSFLPTTTHYFDHKPLLTVFMSILFLIGLIFSGIKKIDKLIVLYILLALLFTNSAATDIDNADHRLMVIIPLLSILIGQGIYNITKYHQILRIILFYILINQAVIFFTKQPANINDYNNWRQPKDYLSMHLIDYIKNDQSGPPSQLCIITSPYNAQNYNFLHYQEQRKYYLPSYKFDIQSNLRISDNELLLFKYICPTNYSLNDLKSYQIDCSNFKNRYYCPLNYIQPLTIYYN